MSCISLLYEVMQKYAVNHVRGKIFMVKVECGVRNDGRLIGQRNIGFYNSKASSRKYIKTSPEHKNIFRNFEDEHLEGHMQKTSINKMEFQGDFQLQLY